MRCLLGLTSYWCAETGAVALTEGEQGLLSLEALVRWLSTMARASSTKAAVLMSGADIPPELIVAAAKILHKRVSGADHSGRAEPF